MAVYGISPNPIQDDRVAFSFDHNPGKAEIVLQSVTGQMMYTRSEDLTNGKNNLSIPADQLSAGVYFLILSKDGKRWAERFVKR